jgi:hypothetical protein
MKAKKMSEDEVYKRTTNNFVFEINGKTVRVREYNTSEVDEIDYDSPYINEVDMEALTDEEHEMFGENLSELMDLQIGEETELI